MVGLQQMLCKQQELNACLGKQALVDVTTGSNNICFGLNAGRSGSPWKYNW